MNKVAVNKYVMIQGDGTITGLCCAETMEEAEAAAAALGYTGTIMSRPDFEKTPEHAALMLQEKRNEVVRDIVEAWQGVGSELRFIADSALEAEGVAQKSVAVHALSKLAWTATATEGELNSYNAAADAQLKV